jgi:hypothetical protein
MRRRWVLKERLKKGVMMSFETPRVTAEEMINDEVMRYCDGDYEGIGVS